MKNDISIVISAPSGAGKSTIIERLLRDDPRFEFSVSTTTRKSRGGERDGRDYFFISEPEFLDKIEKGDFIEWARVHGNYYGTTKKEVDRIKDAGKIPIFDVDIQGTKNLQKNIQDAVYIFIVPPSLHILEQRLKNRKTDSEDQINIRLKNALSELSEYHIYDYLVINDTVETALRDVQAIVSAEQCRTQRNSSFMKDIMEAKDDHPPR
ncbi:MAG TPA: guanylate kinase [Spirochaetota bacterium]|nr:guanylate kinase [Spirochaetota bacterium]HPI88593.1 guanylate kinase [Spirochaetota bacterium]HPR48234.1 guanylate kinase [Spirochaetota bacterium]